MKKLVFTFAVLLCCWCYAGEPASSPKTLSIQPLGKVSTWEISAVKLRVEKEFGFNVVVLNTKPMPQEAYYPVRKRYRAEKLLSWLRDRGKTDFILGITDKDISATKGNHPDWGILGQAYTPGKAAIISKFRTRKPGPVSQIERLERIAIHEIGHNLGLPHCETKNCTMADLNGSIKVLDTATGFCKKCLRLRSNSYK